MAAQQSSTVLLSAGSTATLDLLDVLSSSPAESLLSTGFDALPAAESSHSFDDLPPFPVSAKPLIFVNELGTSLLKSSSPVSPPGTAPLITSPTGPRLRVMLMEGLSVGTWAETVYPQLELSRTSEEDVPDSEAPEWIPEGSLFSPQTFTALFRKRLSSVPEEPSGCLDDHGLPNAPRNSTPAGSSSFVTSGTASSSTVHAGETIGPNDAPYSQPAVPTIMVSNSTAALPLSFESSHSLHPELPLAVRRGKKLPPALALGQGNKAQPHELYQDPYPDIPTPFLGSPTSTAPVSTGCPDVRPLDMGLSAMCNDLRSRLPAPPPFSPTESVRPPLDGPERHSASDMSSQDSLLSDLDDEEWAFAKELVADWRGTKEMHTEVSPPPSPAGDLPYASDVTSPTSDALSDVDTPSLVSGSSSSFGDDDPIRTPADVKLTRRKTVIIQAPESNSSSATEKTEKVLSIAADVGSDLIPHVFDEPVPFETPTRASLPVPVCDLAIHLPLGSRPSSTASMKPVRGILKEKKSVRFSTVDMFHEYTSAADGSASVPQCSAPGALAPEPPALPRRLASTATVRKNSPLRESYAPMSPAAAEDPAARARARAHSPATRPLQDPPLFAGPTTAKHPAVRALARTPSVSSARGGPSPSRNVAGSGPGGAVVGAPGLHSPLAAPNTPSATPTPALLADQRRAPLRSINARQTMPVERKPHALGLVGVPIKPTRASMLPSKHSQSQDTATAVPAAPGLGRRVLRAASIPAAPRNENDENAVRRRSQPPRRGTAGDAQARSCGAASAGANAGSGGRPSRMSAPLRSIFTKLRT
ncbi:hypothetical protein C8Q77DRAFT_1200257 [Trametes polyzona]|nr:hypothetical protein C8Q77DRAFT_1200257 [Trametes polyzona]